MLRSIRHVIPSMFHRRLLLLGCMLFGVFAVLATQMARLTVVQGAVRREKAEAVLVQRRLISTARGRILDRQMRVLAVDRPSYNISVRYPVITGDWAYSQARQAAYRAHRHEWAQLHEADRQRLAAEYQPVFDQQLRDLWLTLGKAGGVSPADFEQRKAAIIERVSHIASDVWRRRLERRSQEMDEPVTLVDVAQPVGEQLAAHPVLFNVDQAVTVEVSRWINLADQDPALSVWKQVSVEPDKERVYPLETMTLMADRSTLPGPLKSDQPMEVTVEGVGLHLIGQMREVWKEDVDRRPFRTTDSQGQARIDLGGYLPGDQTGRWGIELAQEDYLRGTRGEVIQRLDSEQDQRVEPQPGRDVVLSVDIQLQARIQAIMDPQLGLMRVQPWQARRFSPDPTVSQPDQPLYGAVVVMDVAQGQVLAAVSTPGFSLQQLRSNPQSVWEDSIGRPYLNRVVGQPYQPGSTVKPLVLAMAVTDGDIAPGQTITCEGHLDPESPNRYRCWIYKTYHATHGPLGAAEAIARSCNIFFYTLGRRMGAHRLVQWYDLMQLGKTTGCGLPEEQPGDLPDLTQADLPQAAGFSQADAIFMAIGQGPIRWTPLQAANCYAALARGGYRINPTFILVGKNERPRDGVDLQLNPRGVELAMQGMYQTINESYGSANQLPLLHGEPIFNITGVKLYGKSGTAQGVPLWSDEDGDRRYTAGVDRIVRRGDHAWTICLVQRPGSTHPDYVVAVVVEFGGSGGVVAGPVANQVLHAMRAEGYL